MKFTDLHTGLLKIAAFALCVDIELITAAEYGFATGIFLAISLGFLVDGVIDLYNHGKPKENYLNMRGRK